MKTKFEKLDAKQMNELSGGKYVLTKHEDCVGQEGSYVSKDVYKEYTWTLLRGWVATGNGYEEYDEASCR